MYRTNHKYSMNGQVNKNHQPTSLRKIFLGKNYKGKYQYTEFKRNKQPLFLEGCLVEI